MHNTERGYTLLTLLIFGVLLALGMVSIVLVTRDSIATGQSDNNSTVAYTVALAGISWAQGNLTDDVGKSIVSAAADGTASTITAGGTTLTIHPFNADDVYGGVGVAPPAVGTSNEHWIAWGAGHYALVAGREPLASDGVVVRALGQVGEAQVMLEVNLLISVLRSMPAGLTGCFSGSVQITFYDQETPYDYYGNMRFDGNGGVPIGMSDDHNRLNGLARLDVNTADGAGADDGTSTDIDGQIPTDASPTQVATYPNGRRWRGTQTVNASRAVGGEAIAAGLSNGRGGTTTTSTKDGKTLIGLLNDGEPLPGWVRNQYIANDPRLVDALTLDAATPSGTSAGGLGMNPFGRVDGALAEDRRGVPLIGFLGTPGCGPSSSCTNMATVADTDSDGYDDSSAKRGFQVDAFLNEEDWAALTTSVNVPGDDNKSRKGFYGCDNHYDGSGKPTAEQTVNMCSLGVEDATTSSTTPAWTDMATNHSGRAWGVVAQVVRHCTGSGNSIDPTTGSPWFNASTNPNGVACNAAFDHLRNVAACLVLPSSAAVKAGTNSSRPSGDSVAINNFSGCHPGCLTASAAPGDSTATTAIHPYRSTCVNLDPTRVTTYGPDVKDHLAAIAVGTSTALGATSIGDPADTDTTEATTLAAMNKITTSTTAKLKYRAPYLRHWQTWVKANDGTTPAPATASTIATEKTEVAAVSMANDIAVDAQGNIIYRAGSVSEVGNPSLITRLDLTDRGPLGTCQQNCLGYGYGRDVTYGAHRTDLGSSVGQIGSTSKDCYALVPKDSATPLGTISSGVAVHCNLDYDLDGVLDRKSYAIASSYREECADPHDGVSWVPTFNISSDNTNLLNGGCVNDLPNFDSSRTITAFCDQGELDDINTAIAELTASGAKTYDLTNSTTRTTLQNVSSGVKTTGGTTTGVVLQDSVNWFGGAECHVGTPGNITYKKLDGTTVTAGTTISTWAGNDITVPSLTSNTVLGSTVSNDVDAFNNPDFWVGDECQDPQVVLLQGSNTTFAPSMVCGCGVLILENVAMDLTGTSTANHHFLWRGLVVWRITETTSTSSGNSDANGVLKFGNMSSGNYGHSTFSVDGALLATGDVDFAIFIGMQDDSGTVIADTEEESLKLNFFYNSTALTSVLGSNQATLKSIRRVR